MMSDTLERLKGRLIESPILFAESVPSAEEIDNASKTIGVPFSKDYHEFLIYFGGAMVGPYPIFGLRPVEVMGKIWSVVEVTQRYRKDGVPETDKWVIISEDHAGNPVGMDASGRIWIHDHDFGGLAPLAKDFEEYIRHRCLHINENQH